MERGVQDPFALINLLPVGVICLMLSPLEDRQGTAAGEDGWDILHTPSLIPCVTCDQDDILLRQLEFLTIHEFILATCRIGPKSTFYIRIYLIPFDLPNVQGRLRTRDEEIAAPARKFLKVVLPRVDQNVARWEASDPSSSGSVKCLISQKIDNRTLPEIYGDLSSPTISPDSAGPLASQILSGQPIDGLCSALYRYQRRSVAAMVQRELYPRNILDPLYIPIIGIDGRTFYLQPAKWEILRECPVVAQSRGGVLCEELGTGKTVMTLALVLATLDQISAPEESILDTRPVMTPLAFQYFPSSQYGEARRRAFRSAKGMSSSSDLVALGVPSLLETIIHYVRAYPEGLDLQTHEEELQNHRLWDPIVLNTPFYHHYDIEIPTTNRSKRKYPDTAPRVMYLTNATLIVIPVNLLSQWESEINKHCDSQSFLRVLVLQKEVALPSAKIMASNYDIILMTHTRFSLEARKADVQCLHTWNMCSCPNYPDARVRVPDCRCHSNTNISPLLQVRWKRLVVDEGHVSATVATNLTPFAKLLSVERRWIVTGTPTTNLLGLSFGQSDSEGVMESPEVLDELPDSRSSSLAPSENSDAGRLTVRKWTKDDREDLRKLATMIIHFLAVPHFAADSKLLDSHVVAPLFHNEGPSLGAIKVLEQVMNTVMIRHRISDVEKDILLPPIQQDTVFLDLDSFSLKSYNAMQAIFVINAVDSQRVDQDYFFHKRNAAHLLKALKNMSQIMFWHSDSNLYSIVPTLQRGEKSMLDDPKHENIPDDDRDLLHQAFIHMTAAFEDGTWKAIQGHLDVFYSVQNMPRRVFDTWSPLPRFEDNPLPVGDAGVGFIHAERLQELREFVEKHPLASEERIAEHGVTVCEEEKRQHDLYLKSLQRRKKRNSGDEAESALEFEKELSKRLQGPYAAHISTPVSQIDTTQNGPESIDSVVFIPRAVYVSSSVPNSGLLASSPVAEARIGHSTSPKLNFILDEIQKYAAHEKFLIFSNSPLTLAHVAEGLNLVRVKHFTYTSQVKPKEREQQVLTFETSETYRVFLMELKHGARGLNLITASRVIFCEPVWQADVESQAIKRAHRIGQTRPITVKTLAIRSTMEEMMIARRSTMQEKSGKVTNNWAEESGMRHFIANPRFLNPGEGEPVELSIPLINIPARPSPSQEEMIHITQSKPIPKACSEPAPPQKKRRIVRFAEDL